MHILQSGLFLEFWYVILILIGVGVTLVYYLNHQIREFKNSLASLLILLSLAWPANALTSPTIDSAMGLEGIDFGRNATPDFISSALRRLIDFILDRMGS